MPDIDTSMLSNAQGLRLRTLVWLRWLAIFGQTVTVIIVYLVLDFHMPIAAVLAAILALALLNLGLAARFPMSHRVSDRLAASLLAADILQLAVLDDERLGKDERFASNLSRVRNRAQTDGIVAKVFGALSRDELVERLNAAEIAFGEVNGMEELARHPQLRRAELATPHGRISYPSPAARFDGASHKPGAVPALGAHTGTVIAEIEERAVKRRESA